MRMYEFDLESIMKSKQLLDVYFKEVPRGKQPKDLWKDPISLAPNSGYRNKMFSKASGIVNLNGTVEDAYYNLMEYAEERKELKIIDRGLCEDEIWTWAKWMKGEFEQYANVDFPLSVYFEYIVGYYVVASFRGFSAEYEFADWLNTKLETSTCYTDGNTPDNVYEYFQCKNNDEMDRKYMIDLLVLSNDDVEGKDGAEIVGGDVIQIKNRSFLLGGGYDSFDKDYKSLKEAAKNLKDKYNTEYYFAFYDTDGGWLQKQDGRFLFHSRQIFELFDKNDRETRKRIVKDRLKKRDYIITDLK